MGVGYRGTLINYTIFAWILDKALEDNIPRKLVQDNV